MTKDSTSSSESGHPSIKIPYLSESGPVQLPLFVKGRKKKFATKAERDELAKKAELYYQQTDDRSIAPQPSEVNLGFLEKKRQVLKKKQELLNRSHLQSRLNITLQSKLNKESKVDHRNSFSQLLGDSKPRESLLVKSFSENPPVTSYNLDIHNQKNDIQTFEKNLALKTKLQRNQSFEKSEKDENSVREFLCKLIWCNSLYSVALYALVLVLVAVFAFAFFKIITVFAVQSPKPRHRVHFLKHKHNETEVQLKNFYSSEFDRLRLFPESFNKFSPQILMNVSNGDKIETVKYGDVDFIKVSQMKTTSTPVKQSFDASKQITTSTLAAMTTTTTTTITAPTTTTTTAATTITTTTTTPVTTKIITQTTKKPALTTSTASSTSTTLSTKTFKTSTIKKVPTTTSTTVATTKLPIYLTTFRPFLQYPIWNGRTWIWTKKPLSGTKTGMPIVNQNPSWNGYNWVYTTENSFKRNEIPSNQITSFSYLKPFDPLDDVYTTIKPLSESLFSSYIGQLSPSTNYGDLDTSDIIEVNEGKNYLKHYVQKDPIPSRPPFDSVENFYRNPNPDEVKPSLLGYGRLRMAPTTVHDNMGPTPIHDDDDDNVDNLLPAKHHQKSKKINFSNSTTIRPTHDNFDDENADKRHSGKHKKNASHKHKKKLKKTVKKKKHQKKAKKSSSVVEKITTTTTTTEKPTTTSTTTPQPTQSKLSKGKVFSLLADDSYQPIKMLDSNLNYPEKLRWDNDRHRFIGANEFENEEDYHASNNDKRTNNYGLSEAHNDNILEDAIEKHGLNERGSRLEFKPHEPLEDQERTNDELKEKDGITILDDRKQLENSPVEIYSSKTEDVDKSIVKKENLSVDREEYRLSNLEEKPTHRRESLLELFHRHRKMNKKPKDVKTEQQKDLIQALSAFEKSHHKPSLKDIDDDKIRYNSDREENKNYSTYDNKDDDDDDKDDGEDSDDDNDSNDGDDSDDQEDHFNKSKHFDGDENEASVIKDYVSPSKGLSYLQKIKALKKLTKIHSTQKITPTLYYAKPTESLTQSTVSSKGKSKKHNRHASVLKSIKTFLKHKKPLKHLSKFSDVSRKKLSYEKPGKIQKRVFKTSRSKKKHEIVKLPKHFDRTKLLSRITQKMKEMNEAEKPIKKTETFKVKSCVKVKSFKYGSVVKVIKGPIKKESSVVYVVRACARKPENRKKIKCTDINYELNIGQLSVKQERQGSKKIFSINACREKIDFSKPTQRNQKVKEMDDEESGSASASGEESSDWLSEEYEKVNIKSEHKTSTKKDLLNTIMKSVKENSKSATKQKMKDEANEIEQITFKVKKPSKLPKKLSKKNGKMSDITKKNGKMSDITKKNGKLTDITDIVKIVTKFKDEIKKETDDRSQKENQIIKSIQKIIELNDKKMKTPDHASKKNSVPTITTLEHRMPQLEDVSFNKSSEEETNTISLISKDKLKSEKKPTTTQYTDYKKTYDENAEFKEATDGNVNERAGYRKIANFGRNEVSQVLNNAMEPSEAEFNGRKISEDYSGDDYHTKGEDEEGNLMLTPFRNEMSPFKRRTNVLKKRLKHYHPNYKSGNNYYDDEIKNEVDLEELQAKNQYKNYLHHFKNSLKENKDDEEHTFEEDEEQHETKNDIKKKQNHHKKYVDVKESHRNHGYQSTKNYRKSNRKYDYGRYRKQERTNKKVYDDDYDEHDDYGSIKQTKNKEIDRKINRNHFGHHRYTNYHPKHHNIKVRNKVKFNFIHHHKRNHEKNKKSHEEEESGEESYGSGNENPQRSLENKRHTQMISYDDNESVVKKDGIPRPLGTNGMLGAEIDNIDLMKQQKLESLNIESIVAKILPAVVKSVSANYTVKTTTSPPIINIPTTTPIKKTPTQNSMRTMHHTTVKMKYIKTVLHQSPTNRQKLSKRPTGFPSKRPTGSPFKTKTTQSSTFSVAKPHPTNLENLNMIIRGLKALGISKDIFDEKRSKLATKAPFVTSQHTTPVHPHVIALHDPKRVRILCFGDSLTAGYNNHGKGFFPYCTPLQRNLNVKSSIPVYTEAKGIVGEMTHKQMVSRLPLVLGNATYEYDWVIILGGTNDILHVKNFADDQEFMNQLETVWQPRITKDIEKLHQIAYNNGAHTLLLTVPENSIEAWPDYKPLLKMRQKINDSLRKFAQASNGKTVLCDIDKKMPRHALGPEQESKLWDDHLHMTPEGYTKMANIVAECLKPYLPH